jgi:hypothetical protein
VSGQPLHDRKHAPQLLLLGDRVRARPRGLASGVTLTMPMITGARTSRQYRYNTGP